jgi:hypothetical protein
MAKTKISRKGFGQVEPNHLSAQQTGQIYAQLPVNNDIKIVEQGMFLKYDYANGEMNLTGEGEFMLVYSEEKLYDERKWHHKDFALKAEDFTDGKIYPRLFKVNIGDIYTTNTFGANTSDSAEVEGIELEAGDKVTVDTATGYLVAGTGADSTVPTFEVAKVYTMPDGQPGVKLRRIA